MWFREKETGRILNLSRTSEGLWIFWHWVERGIFLPPENVWDLPELTREEAKFIYLL